MNLNRRSFFLVTGLAGATGLLAACGGGTAGTSSVASASAVAAGGDISQLVAINEQDRTTLQAGGTLTLAVPTLGPNFNVATATGYTTSNLNVMAAVNTATVSGLWRTNALGEYSVNPDYCTAYEASLTDGVQTISIKLNPNAKFNDGTPIDIKALQVTHKTLTADGYDIVDSGAYVHIASIEEDGDPFSVKVTMSEPYFPIEGHFQRGPAGHHQQRLPLWPLQGRKLGFRPEGTHRRPQRELVGRQAPAGAHYLPPDGNLSSPRCLPQRRN